MTKRGLPVLERLALHIKVDPDTRCWVWTGAISQRGYGLAWCEGRLHSAHRLPYQLLIGDVPEGLQLDHLCNRPLCVNPAHLEPVTQTENMQRRSRRMTHCKRGHPRTADNIRLAYRTDGRQRVLCKACDRERSAASRARTSGTD